MSRRRNASTPPASITISNTTISKLRRTANPVSARARFVVAVQ